MSKIKLITSLLIFSILLGFTSVIKNKTGIIEKKIYKINTRMLIIEKDLPNHLQILLSHWFDEKIKIDGFDGDMIFKISNYTQEISSIDASPPESSDFSKEVGLIVNRLIFWLVCTWEIAFPA